MSEKFETPLPIHAVAPGGEERDMSRAVHDSTSRNKPTPSISKSNSRKNRALATPPRSSRAVPRSPRCSSAASGSIHSWPAPPPSEAK
ncbi:hypothetical protein NL676_031511 [Syzygium grande]|nr:hypothetical protein NL676_031511 [Syzygium grande]